LLAQATHSVGTSYLRLRNYDEAIRSFKSAIDLDPSFAVAYPLLTMSYAAAGRMAEAVAEAEKFASKFPPHAGSFFMRCGMYADAGRLDDAVRIHNELKEFARTSYVSPAILGLSYYKIGEIEIGRKLLLEGFEERSNIFTFLNAPWFDRLRQDPFIQDLVRKVGLP
jgi:tetratricopeptide (TPR) repeat protein